MEYKPPLNSIMEYKPPFLMEQFCIQSFLECIFKIRQLTQLGIRHIQTSPYSKSLLGYQPPRGFYTRHLSTRLGYFTEWDSTMTPGLSQNPDLYSGTRILRQGDQLIVKTYKDFSLLADSLLPRVRKTDELYGQLLPIFKYVGLFTLQNSFAVTSRVTRGFQTKSYSEAKRD